MSALLYVFIRTFVLELSRESLYTANALYATCVRVLASISVNINVIVSIDKSAGHI